MLTYSLLLGMRGAALRENEYVGVLPLFSFAADRVPELVQGIGGKKADQFKVTGTTADLDALAREAIAQAMRRLERLQDSTEKGKSGGP